MLYCLREWNRSCYRHMNATHIKLTSFVILFRTFAECIAMFCINAISTVALAWPSGISCFVQSNSNNTFIEGRQCWKYDGPRGNCCGPVKKLFLQEPTWHIIICRIQCKFQSEGPTSPWQNVCLFPTLIIGQCGQWMG